MKKMYLSIFLVGVTLLLTGCGEEKKIPTPPTQQQPITPRETPPPTPPTTPTTPTPTAPTPTPTPTTPTTPTPTGGKVELTTPNDLDLSKPLKSPLAIKGNISKDYFNSKGVFLIILKDSSGKEIARTNAAAEKTDLKTDMLPFSASLKFDKTPTTTGNLVFHTGNATATENSQDIEIKVILKAGTAQTSGRGPVKASSLFELPWKIYKNSNYAFNLSYRGDFSLLPSQAKNNIVALKYPNTYLDNTNLQNAEININMIKNGNCSISEKEEKPLTQIRVENGITFHRDEWSEGTAGHKGDQVGYYVKRKGNCYKIILSMYSTNLSMYPNGSAQMPAEFDRDKIEDIFHQILATFNFA